MHCGRSSESIKPNTEAKTLKNKQTSSQKIRDVFQQVGRTCRRSGVRRAAVLGTNGRAAVCLSSAQHTHTHRVIRLIVIYEGNTLIWPRLSLRGKSPWSQWTQQDQNTARTCCFYRDPPRAKLLQINQWIKSTATLQNKGFKKLGDVTTGLNVQKIGVEILVCFFSTNIEQVVEYLVSRRW